MLEYKLPLGGTNCSVVEWNPEGKVPLFAFHGWLDNLATFETLIPHLEDIRFIAVDFPGHGHSDHIEQGQAYHFLDGIFLIDDLIEHFDLDKVSLLGHSMGGAIASIYAGIQADKIDKLVLIEALGPVTSPTNQAQASLNKALVQRRALKHKRKPIYQNFNQALLARAEVADLEPKLLKPLVERALTSVEDGYTWRADSRLRIPSTLRLSENQVQNILPSIEAPTLMIEADSGLLISPEVNYVQKRKTLVQELKVCNMPGGHHLHLEHPDKVAQRIKEFLL